MKFSVYLVALASVVAFAGCSSGEKNNEPVKYGDKEVAAVSTTDGKRPFWTYDGGWDMEKLRTQYKDNPTDPKYAYVVSMASVKSENLVPNCYSMARTRASTEVANQISELVKEAKAMDESADATSFSRQIESQTKSFLVGAQVIDKTWLKEKDEVSGNVNCWVLMSVPRTNLLKLQNNVMKVLEKEAGGDAEGKARVREASERIMKSM